MSRAIINKLSHGQIELNIEVSQEELKTFLDQACNIISKNLSIPGFRPGYAPYELVKDRVGEMKIYETCAEDAVARTYTRVVAEKKLLTVGRPEITILKLAPQNSLVYKARVALLPEIKIGAYQGIKIKKNKIEVNEVEIESTLKDLQKAFGKEKLVLRQAKKGDKVEIDLETYLDRVPIEMGQSKNHPLFIGEGHFIPGFEENIIGLTSGEKKRFTLKFPKNYHRKDLARKWVDFRVHVKGVFEIELQPLNDAFARQVGKFETLESLRQQLRDNMREEKKVKEQQRWEISLIEAILNKSQFGEIPIILLESELHKMIHELEDDVKNQGMQFEDYLLSIKKTKENLKQEFKPRAEKRIKTALILREIAKREFIDVSDVELEQEYKRQIQQYSTNLEILKHIQTEEYKSYLKNVLIGRKVFEFLERVNG